MNNKDLTSTKQADNPNLSINNNQTNIKSSEEFNGKAKTHQHIVTKEDEDNQTKSIDELISKQIDNKVDLIIRENDETNYNKVETIIKKEDKLENKSEEQLYDLKNC